MEEVERVLKSRAYSGGYVCADFPSNEAERLAVLHSYDVLDTEVEASYDKVTRYLCDTCEVPIALVSLVEKDRQVSVVWVLAMKHWMAIWPFPQICSTDR